MGEKFTVSTSKKEEIVDITEKVREIVKNSGIKDGICVVYTPHATAAIMINENYDPNISNDILHALGKMIPSGKWIHDQIDNNGSAHIKSSIIGPSESVPLEKGALQLGTWQNIMIADFDGPKQRTVIVEVIGK